MPASIQQTIPFVGQAARAKVRAEVHAGLLQVLPNTMTNQGVFEAAEEPLNRSLAIHREHLGEGDPLTLMNMNDASSPPSGLNRWSAMEPCRSPSRPVE